MSSQSNQPPKKRGVKLNNDNSTVPKPKQDTSALFNKQADEVFSKIEDFKKRSFELGSKFKAIIEDKKLSVNKTQINKDLEQEVLNNLVILANDMNADENQPEGVGSVAVSMLLMKMLLIQRDSINDLSFKVETIEKALNVFLSEKKENKS